MLRLALALLFVASMPATAFAAGFGEIPSQPVSPASRCVRATGAPGELVRWAPEGAEFLQATRSGFGAPTRIALGDGPGDCPIATAQPSGAAVLVDQLYDGVGVAVRAPGGAWGPSRLIARPERAVIEDPTAAVSPSGDAVVAWVESRLQGDDLAARVVVARIPAGGAPGTPIELLPLTRYRSGTPKVRVGIQGDGTIVALFSRDAHEKKDRFHEIAFAATAAPGAAFGPAQRLSSKLDEELSLTVAPDGRALAIVGEPGHTHVMERPPGGTFAPVADLGYTEELFGPEAIALAPDGAAIVAWQDLGDDQVMAIRRDRPGPFGRPERVGAPPQDPYGVELAFSAGGAPSDLEGRGPAAAFAGDGRPVLTWGQGESLGKLAWVPATVTTFPGAVQALSGPLRDADSIAPVILADGTPAVAWSDVSVGGDSQLHLAIEGVPAPAEPPAPQVEFGRAEQIPHGLAVPFRCSDACDVRATVPGGEGGRRSLRAAGSGRLKIVPEFDPIALRRPDSVPVQVLSGAPGAHTAATRTITAKLRVPKLPRLLGLKAVRRGKVVAVSWRTDRPLRNATVIAVSSRTRSPEDPFLGAAVEGEGRRRFHLNVSPISGDRYVQLYVLYTPDSTEWRIAVVRIR
jgi:hypothetical protein